MAAKTPRTALREYMENVSTDRGDRTQRRRTADIGDLLEDPIPGSSGKVTAAVGRSSPRLARKKGTSSVTGMLEQDVTPRHLIQNMLTVHSTDQPATRTQQRVSDATMPPPRLSTARKATKRRRSSTPVPDFEDITRKFTPRSNIAGFLEQAEEETPAVRSQPANSDSHTEGDNSSFTLNEVGISMLEKSSIGMVAREGERVRTRTRRGNLNINLLQAIPRGLQEAASVTPADDQPSEAAEENAEREVTTNLNSSSESAAEKTGGSPQPERGRERDNWAVTPGSRGPTRDFTTINLNEREDGDTEVTSTKDLNRTGGRNIFSDVFGESEPTRTTTGLVLPTEVTIAGMEVSIISTQKLEELSVIESERSRVQVGMQGGDKTPGADSHTAADRRTDEMVAIQQEEGEVYHRHQAKRSRQDIADASTGETSTPSKRQRSTVTPQKRRSGERGDASISEQTSVASRRQNATDSSLTQESVSSPRRSARKSQASSSAVETPSAASRGSTGRLRTPAKLNVSTRDTPGRSASKRTPQSKQGGTPSQSASKNTPQSASRSRGGQSTLDQFTQPSTSPSGPSTSAQSSPRGISGIGKKSSASASSSRQQSGVLEESTRSARKKRVLNSTLQDNQSQQISGNKLQQSPSLPDTSSYVPLHFQRHLTPHMDSDVSTPHRVRSTPRGPLTSTPRPRNQLASMLQSNASTDAVAASVQSGGDTDEIGPTAGTDVSPFTGRHQEDGESSEDEDEYSPLKTPRLPPKQATPATQKSIRRSGAATSKQAAQAAGRKGPRGNASVSGRKKKSQQGLPTSVVKQTFTHFCHLRVSKDAIAEVEKLSEQYFKTIAEDLEAYATHAHRKTIDESDVHLLMRRQGFVTDKCSLNTLIATYLPLELRQELIPIARSGNKLEPKK